MALDYGSTCVLMVGGFGKELAEHKKWVPFENRKSVRTPGVKHSRFQEGLFFSMVNSRDIYYIHGIA